MIRQFSLFTTLVLVSGLVACSSGTDGPANGDIAAPGGWGVNTDVQGAPGADAQNPAFTDTGTESSGNADGEAEDEIDGAGSVSSGPDVVAPNTGTTDGSAGIDEEETAGPQGPPCDGGVVCAGDEVCTDDGLCVPEVCEPNPCVTPPNNDCDDLGNLLIYEGVCTVGDDDAAVCTYEATVSPCGVNQSCLQGVCTVLCADNDDCADEQVCSNGGCVSPPPACCSTLGCNPAFEECLATEDGTSCFCDPIFEVCLFDGDDCPLGYTQADPYVCIDYGGQEGICRVACEGPSAGMPDTCEGAEWLCGALPGYDGYCLPADCSGYFDDDFDACGPDATCLPTLDGSNVCVPDGPDDEGDYCGLHNECGHGLLCIDNFCSYGECSVDTQQIPCADGITCLAWTVGVSELSVGNCAADCLVFTDQGCTEDEWCFPLANVPDGMPVDGYCVPSGGTAFEGMACDLDPNACVDGTSCVVSPDNDVATCEPLCSPSAAADTPGSCKPGRGCSPLFMVNEQGLVVEVMDYGSCIPACAPWVPHVESGCPATNWCEPMLFNSHAGECKGYFGQLSEGEVCNEISAATSCGEGLFCLGFMTSMGMDGICHRLCDVDGGLGATCAENQVCDELVFTGADDKPLSVAVGVCAPDPDWVPPGPEGCLDGEMLDCAEQCIPAALLGNGECDEALNCDLTTWDMGDCPEPE